MYSNRSSYSRMKKWDTLFVALLVLLLFEAEAMVVKGNLESSSCFEFNLPSPQLTSPMIRLWNLQAKTCLSLAYVPQALQPEYIFSVYWGCWLTRKKVLNQLIKVSSNISLQFSPNPCCNICFHFDSLVSLLIYNECSI